MSESAYSDEVAPLLEAVSSAAKHAAAIVRIMNAVEGQGCRPLSEQEYAAVELVVSAVELLAHRADITSEDRHVVDVDRRDSQFESSGLDTVPELLQSLLIELRAIRRGVCEPDGDPRRDHGREALAAIVRGDQKEREPVLHRKGDEVFERLQRVDVEAETCARVAIADDEHIHDASPSAGERAEPGRASTLSVEGEPAAGASVSEAPAAPSSAPLDAWAGEIGELVGQLREATLALRAIGPESPGWREYAALAETRDAHLAELRTVLITAAPAGTLRLAEAITELVELAKLPSSLIKF